MGRLYARLPDDADVASFYALALLGTMSRSLIGYVDAHEGHNQTLAGSEVQTQVAGILDRVLRSHPEHPGALHYLLHNHDDPEHARLALAAARTLARLAPDSSHTRHMPAHIFLQPGQWRDAAASDRAAFAASEAWMARKHLGPAMRNYHALAWLQYELLQLGRYRDAWATIDHIAPVVKATGDVTLLSDLSSMRARYSLHSAPGGGMNRSLCFAPPRMRRRSFRRRSGCRRRSSRRPSCSARSCSRPAGPPRRLPRSKRRFGATRTDRSPSSASRALRRHRGRRTRRVGATPSCSPTSTVRTRICPRFAKRAPRSPPRRQRARRHPPCDRALSSRSSPRSLRGQEKGARLPGPLEKPPRSAVVSAAPRPGWSTASRTPAD